MLEEMMVDYIELKITIQHVPTFENSRKKREKENYTECYISKFKSFIIFRQRVSQCFSLLLCHMALTNISDHVGYNELACRRSKGS